MHVTDPNEQTKKNSVSGQMKIDSFLSSNEPAWPKISDLPESSIVSNNRPTKNIAHRNLLRKPNTIQTKNRFSLFNTDANDNNADNARSAAITTINYNGDRKPVKSSLPPLVFIQGIIDYAAVHKQIRQFIDSAPFVH